MSAVAFFFCAALIATFAFGLGESLQVRRRAMRRELVDARGPQSEMDFGAAISADSGFSGNFARAFRLAVGRALGVDPYRLRAQDRLIRDLHVLNFDAIELAALLERAFDVRVRVIDVVRAANLGDLCRLVHERTLNVSEVDPPLHRDPIPRLAESDPIAVPPAVQPPQHDAQ